MRATWSLLLLLLPLSACVKADPEDAIGRFAMLQSRTDDCGDGTLLASPEERKVVVYLRRVSAAVLHWQQGEELWVLSYDALTGSFSSRAQQQIDMRAGDTTLPTCIVARDDSLEGTLTLDATGDGETIEGHLAYDFAATDTSACEDLLSGELPIAKQLPCSIGYDLLGEAF